MKLNFYARYFTKSWNGFQFFQQILQKQKKSCWRRCKKMENGCVGQPQGKSRKLNPHEPNNYNGGQANKVSCSPDSLPGCLGYFSSRNAKCKSCRYASVCKKTLPREACLKLLQEILHEIEETKRVLKI
jgi:hypothetical protein